MKKIFKQFDKVGLVVLLLTAITVMGFKVSERALASTWYHVSLDVNQGLDKIIGSGIPVAPCILSNGILCAIEIELIAPNTTFPTTLAEAEQMEVEGKINIPSRKFQDEED